MLYMCTVASVCLPEIFILWGFLYIRGRVPGRWFVLGVGVLGCGDTPVQCRLVSLVQQISLSLKHFVLEGVM